MRTTVAALALVGLCACASVQTASFPDQTTAGHPAYSSLMVVAATVDLNLRRLAEEQFAQAGASRHIDVVPSSSVFMPGQVYADSSISAELRRRGIDGVLILTDATTAPPTVTTTASVIPLCSLSAGARCLRGTTIATARTDVRQDTFKIVEYLMDVRSGRTVWTGSSDVHNLGGAVTSNGRMIGALARAVTKTLAANGFLQPASSR